MGPIKISIATTTFSSSSEYGGTSISTEPSSTVEELNKIEDSQVASDKEKEQIGKNSPKNMKSQNDSYIYEGDDCFYIEPASGVKFKWDNKKSEWVNNDTGEGKSPGHAYSNGQQQQNYKVEDGTYVYVDKLTNQKYKWNLTSNDWDKVDNDIPQEDGDDESEEDENATEEEKAARQYRKRKAAPGWDSSKYTKDPETGNITYKDPNDGVVYEFDSSKNAWFPKLDDDFMAAYQINYGFTADGKAEPTKPSEEEIKTTPTIEAKKPKTNKDEKAKWFEEEETKSTKVYVSNLPLSMTEESFIELMSKCGMIEHDVRTKKAKIKLYKDSENILKGDGLCSYIKTESVQLALTILDGSEVDGKIISVERAKFEMKGEYNPDLKPKKLTKKQIEKAKKQKEKLFAWIPDKVKGERAKHEKVIVIKNMFEVKDLDDDPGLILDFSNKIRLQCSKIGSVSKVCLYDKHPEGVCQVFFKDPSEADMAVQMLNGRLFGSKIMTVATWDGKTKYKLEESKEEESERLKQWEKYLEADDEAGVSGESKPVTGDSDLH